ncbi:hypothetical protein MHP7448_0347 [Mesomycoplasma hyopneumoniae 7448]|uniref:Uncharacterized protein n=1 Tax=Mesomycoplasma hyopneumoniae (strain 7448) TaxID=262722 RepID=Q4A821_MESH7|nr:hypothetical protein MHP7448_0347 [Mesomycoplasma hyopneumoniae 7448]
MEKAKKFNKNDCRVNPAFLRTFLDYFLINLTSISKKPLIFYFFFVLAGFIFHRLIKLFCQFIIKLFHIHAKLTLCVKFYIFIIHFFINFSKFFCKM